MQQVKAIFPDAGVAALVKYQWKDAPFSFGRSGVPSLRSFNLGASNLKSRLHCFCVFFLLSFSCCVEVMSWQSCMAARQCHDEFVEKSCGHVLHS